MINVMLITLLRNLAKLDIGLDESPTVMVGEAANIRGILKPSCAFVETNKHILTGEKN